MVSIYTPNLGVEKPAAGDKDGTWGTMVNTAMDLFDEAIGGIISISLGSAGSSGSPNDLPITNGASSNGRNAFITITDGGDLGADVYVQFTPDDAERVCYIQNSLSGSQDLYLFQGTYNSSRDYIVAADTTVLVRFSGTGASSSTVTNVLTTLQLEDKVLIDNAGLTTKNEFYLNASSSTIAQINFDSGDALLYDRTDNEFGFFIGSGNLFSISASQTASLMPSKMLEASAATGDDAGYGQMWVKDDAPCTPWFTADDGTEGQLASKYEAGAWTPTITDGSNDATQSSSVAAYTRVGNVVHIAGRCVISSLGSMSGQLYIKTLPFTSAGAESSNGGIVVAFGGPLSVAIGGNITGIVAVADTKIALYTWDTTNGSGALLPADLTTSSNLTFHGYYRV